jgi:hypothetical protein
MSWPLAPRDPQAGPQDAGGRATKSEVQDELDEQLGLFEEELAAGVKASAGYTVAQPVQDWISSLVDLAPKTISVKHEVTRPLLAEIGEMPLRDLEAEDVLAGLKAIRDSRACLVAAITYAQARRKIGRNVAALTKSPPGKRGGRRARR